MKNLIAIMFSLWLLVPVAALAEVKPDDSKQIDQAVSLFIDKLNAHKTEEAYKGLMLPLMSEQQAAMRNLYAITDQVVNYFETPFTYEKVEERSLGSMLVYRKYVLYNDKLPYIVSATFFKTSAGWKCQRINLADLTDQDITN